MLGLLLFLAGALLSVATILDFFITTVGMAGLGPMTRRIANAAWRVAARLVPALRRRRGIALDDAVGPAILALIAATWIVLNGLGYTLMFGARGALVDASTKLPVDAVDRVAFAGSALSTLGASLSQPGSGWWDILSMIAAINGMVVLTLSVSFVMTVLNTTSTARSLALRINALAARAGDLDNDALAAALARLGAPLAGVVLELRAAPIVGYFATRRQSMNVPRAILSLCALVERLDPLPQGSEDRDGLAELRLALRELGQLDGGQHADEERPGLDLTRDWARRRLMPDH